MRPVNTLHRILPLYLLRAPLPPTNTARPCQLGPPLIHGQMERASRLQSLRMIVSAPPHDSTAAPVFSQSTPRNAQGEPSLRKQHLPPRNLEIKTLWTTNQMAHRTVGVRISSSSALSSQIRKSTVRGWKNVPLNQSHRVSTRMPNDLMLAASLSLEVRAWTTQHEFTGRRTAKQLRLEEGRFDSATIYWELHLAKGSSVK